MRDLAFVKRPWSIVRDPPQQPREVRLPPMVAATRQARITEQVYKRVLIKLRRTAVEMALVFRIQLEALYRQPDRRL